MSKLSSDLVEIARNMYKGSKTLKDLSALTSGKPKRILKRVVNSQIGKMVGKVTKGLYLRGK